MCVCVYVIINLTSGINKKDFNRHKFHCMIIIITYLSLLLLVTNRNYRV